MQPSIRILFVLFSTIFLFCLAKTEIGKLTETENFARLSTCGKETQEEYEYGGIFLKDETNSHFRFNYNKEKCKNNIQQFTINTFQKWPGNLNKEKQAYYIGSCEDDIPRGFVIVEHSLHLPDIYTPHCLPTSPLHNGSQVEVFTTLNATAQSLEFIMTKLNFCKNVSNEMCTEQVVTDFGGPVLDSTYENKTYVGHAFTFDEKSIHVVPIYQYLSQVCEVTGICDTLTSGEASKTSLLPPSLSKSKLSFVDPDEPLIHVNFPSSESSPSDPIFTSLQTFVRSEVIDVGETEVGEMEVEIEEIEGSGTSDPTEENNEIDLDSQFELVHDAETPLQAEMEPNTSGEKILILFKSEEVRSEPDYEPFVMSVVPQKKVAASAPDDSTIVRAEPFSAVIIPLSEQNNGSHIKQEFSTPEELLIAFLIMLSVVFFALMCLYGFVDYRGGKRFYWECDLGRHNV